MKRIPELNVGALILLTFAVGCGGSSSNSGAGGASSSGGAANGGAANGGAANGGAANGGAPTTPGGGAHASGGQTSNAGSAGAAPGGSFTTSVPGTTPLKDLTPDQVTQLCGDLQKFTESSLSAPLADFECKALGLEAAAQATTDAAAQTACTDALTGCTPDPSSGTSMCNGDTPATCTATVADVGVCANDTAAVIAALSATVPSCDGMTLAQAQAALIALGSGAGTGFKEPASCSKYDAECGSMTGM